MNYEPLLIQTKTKRFSDYEKFIAKKNREQIYRMAHSLRNCKVVHLNTTSSRGGVAESLRTLVPLMKDLDIKTSWYVLSSDSKFDRICKLARDYLQGKEGNFSSKDKAYYLSYNRRLAKGIKSIDADIWIIHDPQPLASINFLPNLVSKKVWYCHMDTSTTNKKVWRFFFQYFKSYNHFIFLSKKFVPNELIHSSITILRPGVDPLSNKNTPISKKRAKETISSFGVDTKKPLIAQVGRFDQWKDPKGVINAYRLAKRTISDLQLAFVAKVATNYNEVNNETNDIIRYANGDKDIHFIINAINNPHVVNSFQRASDVIIHKSIREGFGQSATEAMWKRNALIGGMAIGIRQQIKSGKNGYLVKNSEECSKRILQLLSDKKLKKRIGINAHYTVKKRFLITNLLQNYLLLFNKLIKRNAFHPFLYKNDAL